jgi:hypothetical protein
MATESTEEHGKIKTHQGCLHISMCKESRNSVESLYDFRNKYKYVQEFHFPDKSAFILMARLLPYESLASKSHDAG